MRQQMKLVESGTNMVIIVHLISWSSIQSYQQFYGDEHRNMRGRGIFSFKAT